MLAKRIIPCLDVNNGRVVKGVNFVGLRDAGDPVELAARYNAEGADELVFLDIGATIEGRQTLINVVEQTAREVFIPLTVGGGVRSVDGRVILELINVVNLGSARDVAKVGDMATWAGSIAAPARSYSGKGIASSGRFCVRLKAASAETCRREVHGC